MTDTPGIHGVCPPRFDAVRDAFARNFTDAPEGLNEQAARFSVCVEGETVIDVWAGRADAAGTTPFGPDTLTPVFSTGKAVMALLIAWAATAAILFSATKLYRLLGPRALTALERLMGMVLVAISVQMTLDGIAAYLGRG